MTTKPRENGAWKQQLSNESPSEKEKCSLSKDSALPPLYVITVNYRSEQYVRRLRDLLGSVDVVNQLIIVDHSESALLTDSQGGCPTRVVRQRNEGYGAGLNRGLQEVEERDAIALLRNPDVEIVNPERIPDILSFMAQNPQVGCVVPSLVDSSNQTAPHCRKFYSLKTLLASRLPIGARDSLQFYRDHLYRNHNGRQPFRVDWGSGCALFVRTSLFPDQVSFDERFFLYFEDVDLCTQLWQKGFEVVCYPKLFFMHHAQKKSHTKIRFFLHHVVSLVKYMNKYQGLPRRVDLQAAPAIDAQGEMDIQNPKQTRKLTVG